MTEKPAPSGDLRDQTAEALPCPVCPAQAGEPCHRAREGNQQPHMSRLLRADAVLSVVEAETAALRQRAEEAERERDDYRQRFANQMTAATELTTTLREAERKLQQALEAIADERRGRLAAEAAARRAREVHRRHDCTRHVLPGTPAPCANEGLCVGCAAPWPCPTVAALDAEQPKETP